MPKKLLINIQKFLFLGKIEDSTLGSQSNYSSFLKYEFLKKNKKTKAKKKNNCSK